MGKASNRHKRRRDSNMATPQDNSNSKQVGYQLPFPPPDDIFKNRRNRVNQEANIIQGTVSYIPQSLDYIDGEGIFVNYYGVPYKRKTMSPPGALQGVNTAKRSIVAWLSILSMKELRIPILSMALIGKRSRGRILNALCYRLNAIADITLMPYYLGEGYYSKMVKELRRFVASFLVGMGVDLEVAEKTSEVIGCMFEYDDAYQFRLQDLLTEVNMEALLSELPKELERLLDLEGQREPEGLSSDVYKKFKNGAKILSLLWKVPNYRKVLRESLKKVTIEKCRMDEADVYHTLLYGSYYVGGRTHEQNLKILAGIHGPDQSKWPPRIQVK